MDCNVNQKWNSNAIKQYSTVEKIKRQLRKGNWKYLCEHPEIRAILRVFLHEAVNKQPENIYEFGAKIFDRNTNPMLTTMVNQQLKRVNAHLKRGQWSEYDGEMLFGERESSHSLLSSCSITESLNSLLSYALVLNKNDT